MKFQAVRGTRDIFNEEAKIFLYIETTAQELFLKNGYKELRTPIFEQNELFTRTLGDTADIVTKEMYVFKDRGDRLLALRPEGTAPVVRAAIEHSILQGGGAKKIFYAGPMFRYERPQKGRYRQFYQIGAEVFGVDDPLVDADVTALAVGILKKTGVKDFKLHINSVGCEACRPKFTEQLEIYLRDKKEKLCATCQERLDKNILRIFDCKIDACKNILNEAPRISNSLCDACGTKYNEYKQYLNKFNVAFIENDALVRGLDYYTGIVFEVKTDLLGSQDAIVAGGRYDNLVEELGGPKTPAVGFAIGEERVAELLKNTDDGKGYAKSLIYCLFTDKEKFLLNIDLINDIKERDFIVEYDYTFRSLKAQMKYANSLGAKIVLIIGDKEIQEKMITVKYMESGEQEEAPLDNILNSLQRK
ncbi:MAG: histidine--tRNA ligase [Elusimicrobiota bacterium]